MPETPVTVHCPTCNRPVEWSQHSPYRPFCSRRCKLIDLGAWLDGSHRIPGSELDGESSSTAGDSNDEGER
ncbi:DNA gyrase inhibitor YacG [Nitrococcus mobilis]|uniref:DNA gyrase inhibitor YacG n=1 Tax=Nitrococcus mobilis TaxID=35797 RepID=UPI0003214142|nr:DNA gyrase inhibitor YacG [Nitrococcus mobilis]